MARLVYVVDDEDFMLELHRLNLGKVGIRNGNGYDIREFGGIDWARDDYLKETGGDSEKSDEPILIIDNNTAGNRSGLDWAEELLAYKNPPKICLISDLGSREGPNYRRLEALRASYPDIIEYLPKPFQFNDFRGTLEKLNII